MASRLNPPLALLALLLAPPLYVAAQGPDAVPPPAGPPLVPLQRVELDARASAAAAVVPDAPLIHTAQLVPAAFRDGAAAQLDQLLLQLQALLRSRGSDLPHVAKLNLYVAREELGGEVLRAAASRFQGEQQPAVSLVATALPHREALVALDAVALAPARSAPAVRRGADAAILPAGSRIYVSGQAEPGTL
ncbi:MAG TPA: RidA family protein, partial [Pirellulaceae bacterium]|nr:RidA family protein [Pirellulaceae bacterium]